MGSLCVTPTLARQLRVAIGDASDQQTASEKAAISQLDKRETQLVNRGDQIYNDKLDGLITPEMYKRKSEENEGALAEVRHERERLRQSNPSFRDDGNMLVSLLRDVKRRYLKAATEAQRRILAIMLDKVVLRPGDEYLTWKEPFATLHDMVRLNEETRVSPRAELGSQTISLSQCHSAH
jgi:hypothetical protein